MGKKHEDEAKHSVIVSFGGPAPGSNPHYPPRHVNVAEEWVPYYTADGGIDVAYLNAQTAQNQFNAISGNTYIKDALPPNVPDKNAYSSWLSWAGNFYPGTVPDTQRCPAGDKSPIYNPAPK